VGLCAETAGVELWTVSGTEQLTRQAAGGHKQPKRNVSRTVPAGISAETMQVITQRAAAEAHRPVLHSSCRVRKFSIAMVTPACRTGYCGCIRAFCVSVFTLFLCLSLFTRLIFMDKENGSAPVAVFRTVAMATGNVYIHIYR